MQQPDITLGKSTIAARPSDVDPRESDTFASLQAEIDKQASLHAASPTDWTRVAALAERYLREEAKDLTVAIWLTAAWLHTAGGPGASAAGQVLTDLLEGYWDELLPLRARARRNQLVWLEERLERFMSAGEELPALTEDAYATMLQNWRNVEQAWRARDDEAPSFASITSRLAQWPVEQVAQETPPPPAPQASKVIEQATAPAATPAQPEKPAAAPSRTETSTPLVTEVATSWDSADALERALDQAMDAIAGALEAGVRDFPENALWYRLNRARVWAAVEQAPPAQQGETRIPGPNDRLRERLTQLMSGSDYPALLAFAESQLGTSRFWLDVNHAAYTALINFPSGQPAAQAVKQETAALLTRIPGLVNLHFADGTPFANDATRQWLAELAAAPVAAGASQRQAVEPALARPAAARSMPASGMVALSAALAAATAQTEAAQTLLNSALSRLHDSALQVASHAITEQQSS